MWIISSIFLNPKYTSINLPCIPVLMLALPLINCYFQTKLMICQRFCKKSLCIPVLILLALHEKLPYLELFWSECGKMQTRITPNTNTFYGVWPCKPLHLMADTFIIYNFISRVLFSFKIYFQSVSNICFQCPVA